MKKKILSALLTAVLLICSLASLLSLTACSSQRSITLRIANQGEYMDPEVYAGFADWYKEKTGEEVIIEYKEFDTCETLYTWIARKNEDYDLVCPSDYMIQRMIREDLLLKLDDETLDVLNEKINPYIIDRVKGSYDGEFAYSCPYLWGTLGIMFNVNSDGEKGLQEDELATMSSWEAIWNDRFRNKIFMKDSVRDAYSVAMIYAKRKELNETRSTPEGYLSEDYQKILLDIFDSSSEGKIAMAKEALMAQKPNVYDYEVDSAKDEMLRDSDGKNGYLGLFWSCDAGYIMTGDSDEDTNKNLYYVVPDEGSNLWVDSFVIPKNAQNVKAANWFIRYLCEGEFTYEGEEEPTSVAFANMDYAGTTTAVDNALEEYFVYLYEDEDGFFEDTYDGFKEMYLKMLFPSCVYEEYGFYDDTLDRCAIMKDLGIYNNSLNEMWIDVLLS